MSDVLDLARAHYQRMRNQKLEIPEWSPAGRRAVRGLFLAAHPAATPEIAGARRRRTTRPGLMALCVILFAKRADGSALFEDTPATLKAIENDIAPAVIARIAARDDGRVRRGRPGRRRPGKLIEGDPETRNLYALALALHKSLGEILDLPVEEIRGWMAYLSRKDS